jgi:hypothetical protein
VWEATFGAFNLPASHHKLDHPQKANNVENHNSITCARSVEWVGSGNK